MHMRKKKWAMPELKACPFYVEDPTAHRGRWREMFPNNGPLHVELGCGKGVSTAEMAADNPDINYVAIDINSDVLAVARRNIAARQPETGAGNILITLMACEKIESAFSAEDRVDRIIISFCNPWSQRDWRHAKRRLTHPRQLVQYRAFLRDGGEIWFKTDDDELFDDSIGYFRMCGFELKYYTRDLHASGFQPNYLSEHERLFTAQGKKTHFLIAVKRDVPLPDGLLDRHIAVPERTTVCYVERDGKYLMLLRNKRENDPNGGKWLGVGGHFMPGETAEECSLREVREETGLTLLDQRLRGVVLFVSGDWSEHMYVFTATRFEGELNPDCDEGELRWIDKDQLGSLPLWEGDRFFLNLLGDGEAPFDLELHYDHDRLISVKRNGKAIDI